MSKQREPGLHFYKIVIVSILMLLLPVQGFGQDATVKGLQWLTSVQQIDGSWGDPLETALRDTASVADAFQVLDPMSPSYYSAIQWLVATDPINYDYVSRRLYTLSKTNNDISLDLNYIKTGQKTDGGWGLDSDHETDLLDTVLVLKALIAASITDTNIINGAITYLLSSQNTDGGWGAARGFSSEVFYTSLVMQALSTQSKTTSIAQAINRAINFLITHQKADGGFGSVFETALAYSALVAVTTDATVLGNAISYITKIQSPDGSWDNDPYSTSLSLQALFFSQNKPTPPPPAPTTGTITGTVIDGGTNQPLSGVTVSLVSNPAISTTTNSSGSFSLSDVPEGTQAISISLSGYTTITANVNITGGSIINLGTLTLIVSPTTGIIQGTVTDVQSTSPLAGVTITITGTTTLTATTAIDGSYKITDITPGTVTLTASKEGYLTLSGTGSIVAGGILIFSPSLSTTTQTATTGDLKGTILDGTSGQPILGASVTMTGVKPYAATSGIDGTFSISAIDPGSYTTLITASGYTAQNYIVSIIAGSTTDLGLVRLNPVATSTTITGKVTDAITGNPIANANVAISEANLSAKTGLDGTYTISGITQLEFNLQASATGYNSKTLSITTASPGIYTVVLSLDPSQSGDIRIASLTTDKTDYKANDPVTISATIENSGTTPANLIVSAQVIDQNNNILALISQETKPSLTINPNSTETVSLSWYTGGNPPGLYSVTLDVMDSESMILLAQGNSSFTILKTVMVDGVIPLISPNSVSIGTTGTMDLETFMNNGSNIDASLLASYEIRDTTGALIGNGTVNFSIAPSEAFKTVDLATFTHTFTQSGEYQVKVEISYLKALSSRQAAVPSMLPLKPGLRLKRP